VGTPSFRQSLYCGEGWLEFVICSDLYPSGVVALCLSPARSGWLWMQVYCLLTNRQLALEKLLSCTLALLIMRPSLIARPLGQPSLIMWNESIKTPK
jgi:hypothetical protein